MAEDTLLGYASRDLDPGVAGDLTENLVEAGVVGGDRKRAVGVGDLRALRRTLGWGEGDWRGLGCCCRRCRQGG
jgi:hypothetical protein